MLGCTELYVIHVTPIAALGLTRNTASVHTCVRYIFCLEYLLRLKIGQSQLLPLGVQVPQCGSHGAVQAWGHARIRQYFGLECQRLCLRPVKVFCQLFLHHITSPMLVSADAHQHGHNCRCHLQGDTLHIVKCRPQAGPVLDGCLHLLWQCMLGSCRSSGPHREACVIGCAGPDAAWAGLTGGRPTVLSRLRV